MKIYNREKMYEGFSLVEMLITITILGFVMVLTATTLTTLIKVSTAGELKSTTRNDVNFVLEFSKRALSNSNLEDIHLYDSYDERRYDFVANDFVDVVDVSGVYASSLGDGVIGNEVHVRVYGYDRWSCIGRFRDVDDPNKSYVVKTSVNELSDHSSCFDGSNYPIIMTSEVVNVDTFDIKKNLIGDGNTMFTVDMVGEPTSWPVGSGLPVSRSVSKQITVMTQGLTWY